MPASVISSSTHSGSSHHSRRYRTRALTSQVDETLFASPQKLSASEGLDPVTQGKAGNRGSSLSAPVRKQQKPETVRIITKDLIRELKIPRKDPSGMSIIFHPGEFQRIASAARAATKEEMKAKMEALRKEKEAAIDAAEDRKAQIRQADLSRQKNKCLSDLEVEARDRAQYLLEKANTMRMEQEDEVKKLNELILGAQCHAVRDAQVLEKQQILAEMQQEERRLDAMMEVDRRRALEVEERIEELRKQQRIQGKMQIVSQMEERSEEQMLKQEIKEQEGQQLLENLEKLQMEELEALERKKQDQQRLQLEILKINEESLKAKERKKEEERLADLHALEYTRKKMEREAEYEAEQERVKREKEKEVARLRALQERDRDHKAEQDELRARRNQEATEREWRKKEREQALKKAREEERLNRARLEQVTHKEHLLAIQAGRERAEFERVLRAQQDAVAEERRREEKHRLELQRHADGVRQQVREREARAIEQRRDVFREGERLNEEARSRRARLDEIKEKKLRELRVAGLPEKYCIEVERKVHTLPTLAL
ncbi:cilia- and flagella-associated protein 45 [Amia ocellicauda]|uniref:cilia- and flagella-associated protein 45 n=1 Tax=Amia ocellicauda TaxID=2972642 RepID=UPI003463FAB2